MLCSRIQLSMRRLALCLQGVFYRYLRLYMRHRQDGCVAWRTKYIIHKGNELHCVIKLSQIAYQKKRQKS